MNRLTQKAQLSISVNGVEVALKASYRDALLTWEAIEDAEDGLISPLAAACFAIDHMLDIVIEDMSNEDINEALTGISEYLSKYAKTFDGEGSKEKPSLCLHQDSVMLYDAFQSMGINLDEQDIAYPRFMSLLRELPKDSTICRIVYLRQQNNKGKLTKEEKEECRRRGWDIIKMKPRREAKKADDNRSYFDELQDRKREEAGLPPINRE